MNNRLALGTVQFGMHYGISNEEGQVDRESANTILSYASDIGINTLDTAIAYGESEQILGDFGVEHWNVISKLPKVSPLTDNMFDTVNEFVIGSVKRLKVSKLQGLLLHNSHDLLGGQAEELYQALEKLKKQGLVEKIGISIYNLEDLESILIKYNLDIVQVPFNVLDRRLATSGWMSRLNKLGIEIHIRSVFLQGLLLMETAKRPATFEYWSKLWKIWDNWLEGEGVSPLHACLSFVNSYPEINKIIVGVNSLKQLQEIDTALNLENVSPPEKFTSNDLDLINPFLWRK